MKLAKDAFAQSEMNRRLYKLWILLNPAVNDILKSTSPHLFFEYFAILHYMKYLFA